MCWPWQCLDPAQGGSLGASLDHVVAKLARGRAAKVYGSAREALLLNGRFVLEQLAAADQRRGQGAAPPGAADKGKGKAAAGSDGGAGSAAGMSGGAFAEALSAEVRAAMPATH